jgi:endonuclease/exonuclease/phosphatase (EEP) superfamily protein YafD
MRRSTSTRTWARRAAVAAVAPGVVAAAVDATGLGERRLRGMQAAPFGPLLSVPAPFVAAAAVVAGWPWVALAALPVAGWHRHLLRSAGAEATNRSRASGLASGSGHPLRLVSVNIERHVTTAPAIVGALLATDADLVLVQELTPDTQPAFAAEAMRDRFPHRFEAPEDGFFGAAIYSRFPIVRADDRPLGGRHMIVAELDVDGTPVTVVSVHTQAPIHPRDIGPWRSGFADLGALAGASRGPVVLAGDWNATTGNRPFRRLLRDGDLVDAHLAVGRGGARTWPAHRRPVPPLLLLDHVVVGGGVAVRAVHERPAPGSDHLAVVADLTIPTAGRAPNVSQ